jgi:pimeloyl-ACP methyl ester carboxylesterase
VALPSIILVHAGIGDSTMWDPLEPLLPAGWPVRRHELRGFGDTPLPDRAFSHVDDLEAVLDGPAVLVGASFGGLVALCVAGRRPDLVAGLVLIDAPLEDHDWSHDIAAHWAEEERLVEAGDLEGAAALNVRFWVGAAPAEVQDAVSEMTLRSLKLQAVGGEQEIELPELSLRNIRTPTLVMVGELDVPDFRRIGQRLARELPRATYVVVDNAAHLPALEQPEATARLIEDFLAGLNAGAAGPRG